MQDRTMANNAAFRRNLAGEIEWYGDLALIMAGCHRRAADSFGNTHVLFGLPAAVLAEYLRYFCLYAVSEDSRGYRLSSSSNYRSYDFLESC